MSAGDELKVLDRHQRRGRRIREIAEDFRRPGADEVLDVPAVVVLGSGRVPAS